MATSSRRKQDEKHLKILRELGSQTNNRTCFDCHQRGTTYINMTVGSFVCTSCSGILRGLNPPHRVKSISMASFTPEEIEQIKSKGNQYCQAVWLGLYDAKSNPFPDTKDEHKIRDFMITKYEKKRFYIDPVVALKNMPPQTSSANSSNASTPSGESSKPAPTINSSVSRPNVPASQCARDRWTERKPVLPPLKIVPPDTTLSTIRTKSSGSVGGALSNASNGSKTSTPKSSASLDLLADLGSQSAPAVNNANDPFASPMSAPPPVSQPSFANFENANIFTNTAKDKCPTTPPPTPVQESSFTAQNDSPFIPPPSSSPPPSQSPSPGQSPTGFNRWGSFDEEDENAAAPLIPSAEALAGLDATGRPIHNSRRNSSSSINSKGRNTPTMVFASGVSAQFVCPTNPNVTACAREEGKLEDQSSETLYSSSAPSRVSMMSNFSPIEARSNVEDQNVSPCAPSSCQKDKATKVIQSSCSVSDVNKIQGGTFSSLKKFPHSSKTDEVFAYSALKGDSLPESNIGPLESDIYSLPEMKAADVNNEDSLPVGTPTEISSKSFAAFLLSGAKTARKSCFGIGGGKRNSISDARVARVSRSMSVELGQVAVELEKLTTNRKSEPKPVESHASKMSDQVSSASSVGSLDVKTGYDPFVNADDPLSTLTGDTSLFDNVPLFSKKGLEASKPITIVGSVKESSSFSSSCPSSTFVGRVSPHTNPFVPVPQPATNSLTGTQVATSRSGFLSRSSSVDQRSSQQSFDDDDGDAGGVFLHDLELNPQPCDPFCDSDKGMTPAHCILAGTNSSNKSTPSGPPPHTFSNSPLTPLAPGSSSASSLPNSSSSSANPTTPAASNQPAQDRYAALKDLDEEFKTQKESETVTSNGGGSWAIPNGSHNSTGVFNGGGTVFGSPGTSNNMFSSGLVNGGSSGNMGGNGVFGTPPTNGGGSAWANFSGANPFSGSSNGTGSPWVNGGNSFGTTNHTQQGFGSVVQPNPFGATPDPNFNQFGSNGPINGTSPNNGAWANFNQQPQSTKMQWMNSNGSANPFMAGSPQMPSSGTSYNPFL